MRTRLSTYLSLTALALAWAAAMLAWAPEALSSTLAVLKHALN